jgi:hypothetical protein
MNWKAHGITTTILELLKRFDYPDAGKLKPNELEEYLFMAISRL